MITLTTTETIPMGEGEEVVEILWEVSQFYKESSDGTPYVARNYSVREVYNADRDELYEFSILPSSCEWEGIFDKLFGEGFFVPN